VAHLERGNLQPLRAESGAEHRSVALVYELITCDGRVACCFLRGRQGPGLIVC